MKVLLINGSPHKEGCTYTALKVIANTLEEVGIDSEIFHIGTHPIQGCIACKQCTGHCVFDGDGVNQASDILRESDGLIVGSPVYYASPNGSVLSFLDRLFYSSGGAFAHKPAAAICSARRGGTTATLDVLNKYFTISQMPVVASTYWNMVHGSTPRDVFEDKEGLQTMRNLAHEMAWVMNCIRAGREKGIDPPVAERSFRTNFVR